LTEGGSHPHRQIFNYGTIYVGSAVDLPGRENSWQGAGGGYRICDSGAAQPGKSPHHLHAGVQIDGVDQQSTLQVVEGDLANKVIDQNFEGFAAIKCRSQQAAEGNIGSSYLKYIPAPYHPGTCFHVSDRHTSSPGGTDEGANAGPHDKVWSEPALVQGSQNPDMGKAF